MQVPVQISDHTFQWQCQPQPCNIFLINISLIIFTTKYLKGQKKDNRDTNTGDCHCWSIWKMLDFKMLHYSLSNHMVLGYCYVWSCLGHNLISFIQMEFPFGAKNIYLFKVRAARLKKVNPAIALEAKDSTIRSASGRRGSLLEERWL